MFSRGFRRDHWAILGEPVGLKARPTTDLPPSPGWPSACSISSPWMMGGPHPSMIFWYLGLTVLFGRRYSIGSWLPYFCLNETTGSAFVSSRSEVT